jgi:hypothetical protein
MCVVGILHRLLLLGIMHWEGPGRGQWSRIGTIKQILVQKRMAIIFLAQKTPCIPLF